MAEPVIQTSFSSGEWAPALNARVDLAKYHAGAALLRNFFVDYRGGASTRAGTRYVLKAKGPGTVRLIPFQVSFTTNYVMEFGENYIRFYFNGAPVLEATKTITGATQANPGVITSNAHGYSNGDWVYITGVGGMTQLNGRYFIVAGAAANTFTLTDLFGVAVNTTTYGAYISGGTAARVFTLPSPYVADDLALLKFAQNINIMVLCHPSYVPYVLTFTSATNWTLAAISFGSNILAPGSPAAATNAAGAVNYSYVVTAVDVNGQESATSAVASSTVVNTAGATPTITFTWTAVSGAVSYNVYRAGPSSAGVVPTGSAFGFVSNVTGLSYVDVFPNGMPLYPADFSENVPIPKNPFQGAGVASATITNAGTYTTVPGVTFGAAPGGGQTATGSVVLQITSVTPGGGSTNNWSVGDIATLFTSGGIGVGTAVVATVAGGAITAFQPMTFPGSNPGSVTSGTVPTVTQCSASGGVKGQLCSAVWGVGAVTIISHGAGYTSAPTVTFSAGAATATAILETVVAGNPQVPIFANQRLVLAAKPTAPQTFNMSQPKSYYNYNISDPIQPDDAIEGTLDAVKLNTIKHFVVMSAGLITLADQQAWLINGSSAGVPPTPIDVAANSQAYNGCSDVPPIVANLDILYVQAKGYTIRSLTFNFYTNIYTGTDISVLSSHLFYGFNVTEWAYAEEPFKLIWAVRDDGQLLSLTYLKEQELIGWAHSDTLGRFKSTCSITEATTLSNGSVMKSDAAYFAIQRTVNAQTIQYIERMAERIFPYGVEDAWCVDSGLQSVPLTTNNSTLTVSQLETGIGATLTTSAAVGVGVGAVFRAGGGIAVVTAVVTPNFVYTCTITQAITAVPNVAPTVFPFGEWSVWNSTTTFSGGEHLAGLTCTGLADGAVIPPFVMPSNGTFTLATAASKVTVGLAFTPQLGTLQLDLGQPTVQGKRKKIVDVSVRCQDTLGLSIGKTLAASSQVAMKDLVVGNLGSQTNEIVTNAMVTGDALTVIDPSWDVPGQYFITQPNPFPASILGVIPGIVVGDG